ncbi:MAG: GNAT family N-acetyltransferase [Lactimicrobium sp.]|jgi:GNAT superfamily N-acetyltransferase|uniref:GNAT family N-acetyltransferase n=1 Tax=Lactimicrobium sp. TaxID=2563780 RepID=UPI002F34FF50
MIRYTEEKKFTKEEIQHLFLSVNWVSGKYPDKLYQALIHSSTVITAWDDRKLVGLARALDDSCMLAQVHYVLVDPAYQGQGIAGRLIELIKERCCFCTVGLFIL